MCAVAVHFSTTNKWTAKRKSEEYSLRLETPLDKRNCSIFISHAVVDQEMAIFLKAQIIRVFPNENIFVSSDPEDLKLGDEWVPKILAALESAKFVLVLATERGLGRKWVWFEAGRTWFTGVTMLPCCVGAQRKSTLPSPFSDRMGANLDETPDVKLLFTSLSKLFGDFAAAPNYEEIAGTMIRLDVRAEERKKCLDDPMATEKMRLVEEQMKGLSTANREAIRQFVIFGELSTAAVRFKVQNTGADMNQWLVPEALSERTGWLVSKPGNTPYDDMQQNVYAINHEMRPFLKEYFAKRV
jgi:hypothetical protein